MRRRVSGGLLCGLIVGGVVSCQKDVPHREAEAAGRAAVLVKLGEFQRGTVSDRLAVAADVDAVQRADVNSEISGVIETLLHREGDEIETGAPVIPVMAVRQKDGRYRIIFEEEVTLERTGDKIRDVEENTARFTGVIEKYVKAYPEQWFWFHKRWKTRPYCPYTGANSDE